jgi:hypothetical protein
MSVPPPDTGGDSVDGRSPNVLARISWTEVAAQSLTVLFAAFLIVRGVPLERAVLTAAATVIGIKVLVSPPQGVTEGVRLLREITQQLRSGR